MTATRGGLVIFGFGGHARSVADVALAAGYEHLVFVDESAAAGETFLDFPVLRALDEEPALGWQCFVAVGDFRRRRAMIEDVRKHGRALDTLISPRATIGPRTSIGPGSFVGHHAHIGPCTTIGEGCIVNTAAVVEHDCRVGDYSHVSIHAAVAGRTVIGAGAMVGAGATIIDGIRIADESTIGAGAVVVSDIEHAGTYVGVPARIIRSS